MEVNVGVVARVGGRAGKFLKVGGRAGRFLKGGAALGAAHGMMTEGRGSYSLVHEKFSVGVPSMGGGFFRVA